MDDIIPIVKPSWTNSPWDITDSVQARDGHIYVITAVDYQNRVYHIRSNSRRGIIKFDSTHLYAKLDWSGFSKSELPELEPEPESKLDNRPEYERLHDFFFGPKRVPESEWLEKCKSEGKCPRCGELGRVHMSAFVCSEHGEY